MNPDQVFILLATYNRAHLVTETLQSIQNQTYKDWQCIIVDDFSSDDTPKVVQEFIADDPRFSFYIKTEDYAKGLSGSRNYGLDLAQQQRAKFIQFFDDDDLIHPQNLETCLGILKNPEIDFCHFRKKSFQKSPPEIIGIEEYRNSYKIGSNQIEEVITNKIALASCTVMWKGKCFENIRFNESLSYAEEWECYSRILLGGFEGKGIDTILYFNRKHADSNTGEFWRGNKHRKKSYSRAAILLLENLKKSDRLSTNLQRFFIQLSIFLKDRKIFKKVLSSIKNPFVKFKYRQLYNFYPIFGFGYRAKKKLKQLF